MAALSLAVPPGFALPVAACRSLGEGLKAPLSGKLDQAIAQLEAETGRTFGGREKPLLLAVRPSVPAGVPSAVEAVLNIGLNDVTVAALATESNDVRFAQECYRRFIQNYAHAVLGDDPAAFEDVLALYKEERGYVSDAELRGSDATEIAKRFKAQFESNNGEAFQEDPRQQLMTTLAAMVRAWHAPRAKTQRRNSRRAGRCRTVPHRAGHGVRQCGRRQWRRPRLVPPPADRRGSDGSRSPQAQGPDLAARLRAVVPLRNGGGKSLQSVLPETCAALEKGVAALETTLRDAVEVEFTVEHGRLWFLSARPGKRSTSASLQIVTDFACAPAARRRNRRRCSASIPCRWTSCSIPQLIPKPSAWSWYRRCRLLREPCRGRSSSMPRRRARSRQME